jgi:hypothetical protein
VERDAGHRIDGDDVAPELRVGELVEEDDERIGGRCVVARAERLLVFRVSSS